MPKPLILIVGIMLLIAWFVVGEKTTAAEKIKIILTVLFFYVALRLMQGLTIAEILAPLLP